MITPAQNQKRRRQGGFTLAELMVVIVIIGLLATLVVPAVVSKLGFAQKKKVEVDLVTIASSVDDYAIRNNGKYPESLEVLVTPDPQGYKYLDQTTVPKDPWGLEYIYQPASGGVDFDIVSYGRDGAPGGEGEDADISFRAIRNQEE